MKSYHIDGQVVPEEECRRLVEYGIYRGWIRPPKPAEPDAVDAALRHRLKQRACMRRLRAERNGKGISSHRGSVNQESGAAKLLERTSLREQPGSLREPGNASS